MDKSASVIAVFRDHSAAELAVKALTKNGFELASLSVVGKGYHTEETAVGFYNIGDRIKLWGSRGAFWGGLWGLFFGGVLITTPIAGPVLVLGFFSAAAILAVESAVLVGGASMLGAAFYSMGIPTDSIIEYETAIKADRFLVMAHGSAADILRAKMIFSDQNPIRIDFHEPIETTKPNAEMQMS